MVSSLTAVQLDREGGSMGPDPAGPTARRPRPRRREDHRRRIEVLKATRARVLEALAALDVSEAKWSQIIQGVVAINGELRKEYGADSAPAEIPVASIRPSDLDGLTDEQLDAVEAAARILEDSTNSQNNTKSKSSNLINFGKKQATG
jgi:hypothetical protein